MTRAPVLPALLLAIAMSVASGCGEESCTDLSGSAAKDLSLSFDDVVIQHFSVGPSLVIKYSSAGAGFPAILSVNSAGVAFGSGTTLEFAGDQAAAGEPAHAFGNATRSMEDGQQFGEVQGGTLTLDSFGGGSAEGDLGFRFKDGESLRGQFCGSVTEVDG